MPADQIFGTLITSQGEVLQTLKEAADLLCNSHTHNMAALDINPCEIIELYTLTIDCGGGEIIWNLEMWPNCRFKAIARCKRVAVPNINPARASLPFLQPRYVWGEGICNEILQLIRIADPGHNWWGNDSVFKSNMPNDLCYFYHPGFENKVQQNQPKTLYPGYQSLLVGSGVPGYYRASERFIQLPSTGN